MKKITVLLSIVFPAMLFAQSVSINTDATAPHNSAMLDIKSDSKGLLMPRLTTLQRTSIPGPATGLTVFDMDTYSYWMYRGDINGGWVELMNSIDKHWNKTGTHVFNINTGNIGIGTNNPTQKLAINATDPAIDFMNGGSSKGYLQASGNHMRLATYANNTTGNIVFNTKAVDRMWIDENGKIGIGTANPTGLLTVNGTNPWIEMQNNGVDKGFLQATGNDLKLGTNSTNTTGNLVFQTKLLDRMLIDENGNVGIGTTTPSSILTVNATDPILQIKNANVDKGFIQLVGDDIKIGTNLSNTYGSFIARTKGQDRFIVNYKGQIGINMPADPNSTYSFSIAEDENDNTGIALYHGGYRRAGFNYNGFNPFLTASTGDFYIYRNSSYPFVLHSDGNYTMGGHNTATGYRLSVYGKTIATEFTALPTGSWPDYVFEKNYKLKPLAEVKKYITENKHLPNIPAAAEVEKNGIQLGDMTKRLMEKVEELTLYIIGMQEQIDALKKNK